MLGLIGRAAHGGNLLGKMDQAFTEGFSGYLHGVGSSLIEIGLFNVLIISAGRPVLGLTLLLHHADGYDGGLIKNNDGNREANLAYYIGGRDYSGSNERCDNRVFSLRREALRRCHTRPRH